MNTEQDLLEQYVPFGVSSSVLRVVKEVIISGVKRKRTESRVMGCPQHLGGKEIF
jgi:hypothetical protein